MAIERIFYCDREDCERHVQTASAHPMSGLIYVTERPGGGRTLHFCGWDCVLKYAASKEPEEIIPLAGLDDLEAS